MNPPYCQGGAFDAAVSCAGSLLGGSAEGGWVSWAAAGTGANRASTAPVASAARDCRMSVVLSRSGQLHSSRDVIKKSLAVHEKLCGLLESGREMTYARLHADEIAHSS